MGLYDRYDEQHKHPVNRALHMLAIPVGCSALVVVWYHWRVALLLVPFALALAWTGHVIEGNRPTTVTNPLLLFVAPLWMVRRLFRAP